MLRKTSTIAAALLLIALAASAQEKRDEPSKGSAITIYNQNFALVRTVFPLELPFRSPLAEPELQATARDLPSSATAQRPNPSLQRTRFARH